MYIYILNIMAGLKGKSGSVLKDHTWQFLGLISNSRIQSKNAPQPHAMQKTECLF